MCLSAVDNALWDLRGKILGKPVYDIIGNVNREQLEVYSRVGEGKDLKEAVLKFDNHSMRFGTKIPGSKSCSSLR